VEKVRVKIKLPEGTIIPISVNPNSSFQEIKSALCDVFIINPDRYDLVIIPSKHSTLNKLLLDEIIEFKDTLESKNICNLTECPPRGDKYA
jgi:hypothetical protein